MVVLADIICAIKLSLSALPCKNVHWWKLEIDAWELEVWDNQQAIGDWNGMNWLARRNKEGLIKERRRMGLGLKMEIEGKSTGKREPTEREQERGCLGRIAVASSSPALASTQQQRWNEWMKQK
jgi:hypothetical protein